jgi:hypothetical protein
MWQKVQSRKPMTKGGKKIQRVRVCIAEDRSEL